MGLAGFPKPMPRASGKPPPEPLRAQMQATPQSVRRNSKHPNPRAPLKCRHRLRAMLTHDRDYHGNSLKLINGTLPFPD